MKEESEKEEESHKEDNVDRADIVGDINEG